jgi:two-component system, LytTR family, response regulator
MINAIIVDDEQDGREALRLAIRNYCPSVNLLAVCGSAQEGIESINRYAPDLVFLDVQMPQKSGFDLLKELSPINFKVIFVSAFDKYAIKAIKFSALDYLLKPVDVDELTSAVNKVSESYPQSLYHYQSVWNNVQHKSGRIERLAVPTFDGIDFFKTEDIIFCKADGNYTHLYLTDNTVKLTSRNLKDFDNILQDSGFCRVHHSFLINISHVQKYFRGEGGYVLMTNNHQVEISRRRKDEFMRLLDRV